MLITLLVSLVISFLLLPICRSEKSPDVKSRLAKLQEERKWNQTQAKLQVLLYRQKEALKRDILRKRSLLEKELQMQIQVKFSSLR